MSLADATVEAGLAGREFKVESRKDHWRSVMRIPEWEPLGAPTPGFLDVWETKELSGVNVVSAENTGVISRVLPTLARSSCKCGKERSWKAEIAEVRNAKELEAKHRGMETARDMNDTFSRETKTLYHGQ